MQSADYSDEMRQTRLTNVALEKLEELMLSGNAPPSVLLYFARQGDLRAKADLDLARANVRVADARVRAMDEQTSLTEMYASAMNALRSYSGGVHDEGSADLR